MKFNLLILVLFPFLLFADKVVVKEGSVIMGKVMGFVDGNLTIETDFAGKLKIPASQISSISSDVALSLRLDDNRTFNQIVTPAPGGKVGLQGNDQSFDLTEIRHLWSEGSEDPLDLIEKKKQKQLINY